MVKILYSPVVGLEGQEQLIYTIEDEVLTVSYGLETDEFDFTDLPEGSLDCSDVDSTLSVQPIRSARKENGILYLELLHFISEDATDEEKFPEWVEV